MFMLTTIIALVSVSFVFGSQEKNIKRSFPIEPGGTLILKTFRGDIEISTYSGNEVNMEAIIYAEERTEADKMTIETEAGRNSVIISTPPTASSIQADIDYYLKVPGNLDTLQLSTLNGEIKLKGTYNRLDLTTLNGDIDVSGEFIGGSIISTNGDIEISLKGALSGDISVRSTNGSIEMTVKPGSDFTVEAGTVSGSIRSEFDTTITASLAGSQLKGTIDKGTYKVSITTVTGDIRLQKR